MNKKLKLIIIFVIGLLLGGIVIYLVTSGNNTLKDLPKPKLSEGLRGKYGIDININETTIDNYLNRGDTVYRDVRMLEDSATWENKGGERNLTGYIKGFEVIPSPYLAGFTDAYIKQKEKENISGLYTGDTLYTLNEDGSYSANYKESLSILEAIFPKDKNIFIMCGAGGYAGQVKDLLISLGWDKNKVYNIGGYWYYEGKNNIEVKQKIGEEEYYDFSKVPYYNIDFSKLHKID